MKNQHLVTLAMAGLVAASLPVQAQATGPSKQAKEVAAPQSKCSGTKNAPQGASRGGVDSSIRSSYSVSSDSPKASASSGPEQKCGADSCNNTTQPKSGGNAQNQSKRSTLKQ